MYNALYHILWQI